MKLLLVRPIVMNGLTFSRSMDCEPLELEILSAAAAMEGVETVIYDGIVETRRFSDVVRKEQPDAAAITGYITQENAMKRYARIVKEVRPRCVTALGGVHVQLNPDRLRDWSVDFLQRSESTEAFRLWLRALRWGGPFDGINGLCVRRGEEWTDNPLTPCDIADTPLPDRSFRDRYADRFRYLDFERVSTLKTAVSCPFDCAFCYGTHLHGGRYQALPPERVADELEAMEAQTVFIVDSDFLVEERRLRALLGALRERGIRKRFLCYARADFLAEHPALVNDLCAAGFTWFLVGFEGIRDDRLAAYRKGTTRSVNEECLRVVREAGGECVALLIADLSFTGEDFRAVARWVRDQRIRIASLSVYTPIPPTAPYREAEERLLTRRPERWDLLHPVLRPEAMSTAEFTLRYRWTLLKLFWHGRRQGAYRFVTARYVGASLVWWWKRRRTLR